MPGDINADGKTDSADAALLRQYLAGEPALTEAQAERADLSGDRQLNAIDLTLLKRA